MKTAKKLVLTILACLVSVAVSASIHFERKDVVDALRGMAENTKRVMKDDDLAEMIQLAGEVAAAKNEANAVLLLRSLKTGSDGADFSVKNGKVTVK